jgi:hypothetical protein
MSNGASRENNLTKEQLAEALNGREIGAEITPEEERMAKDYGLVVIFGASEREDGCSWTFRTGIPHATFNILEDGDLFCRGIVVDLRDLAPEEAERASAEKNLGELRKYNAQWHAQADKHFGKYLEWRARAEKAEAKVAELQEAWNLDFKAELRNTEHINILEAEVAKLREALAYIGDEESGWRFRVDPLEHAHSVIEQMRERARAALDPEPGGDGREDGMSDRDPIKAALAVCEATEAKNWYERELLVQLLVGETVTLDQDALFIETFSPATVAAMLKALELAREALERDDDTYNGRAEDSEAWQHHRQMLREAALAAIDALPMPGTEVSDE